MRKAGKGRGADMKEQARAEHGKWIGTAQRLLQTGTTQREVSGKVASRYRVKAHTVRKVLRREGVLSPKKYGSMYLAKGRSDSRPRKSPR